MNHGTSPLISRSAAEYTRLRNQTYIEGALLPLPPAGALETLYRQVQVQVVPWTCLCPPIDTGNGLGFGIALRALDSSIAQAAVVVNFTTVVDDASANASHSSHRSVHVHAHTAPLLHTNKVMITIEEESSETKKPGADFGRNISNSHPPLAGGIPIDFDVLVLPYETLNVRILIDRPIVEVFVMGGRGSFVSVNAASALIKRLCTCFVSNLRVPIAILTLIDRGGIVLKGLMLNVSAYGMGCGWATDLPPEPAAAPPSPPSLITSSSNAPPLGKIHRAPVPERTHHYMERGTHYSGARRHLY